MRDTRRYRTTLLAAFGAWLGVSVLGADARAQGTESFCPWRIEPTDETAIDAGALRVRAHAEAEGVYRIRFHKAQDWARFFYAIAVPRQRLAAQNDEPDSIMDLAVLGAGLMREPGQPYRLMPQEPGAVRIYFFASNMPDPLLEAMRARIYPERVTECAIKRGKTRGATVFSGPLPEALFASQDAVPEPAAGPSGPVCLTTDDGELCAFR